MTLRQQIMDIGTKVFNEHYVKAAGFPAVLTALAVVGFRNEWEDSIERRAVMRALDMMDNPGYVGKDEPSCY